MTNAFVNAAKAANVAAQATRTFAKAATTIAQTTRTENGALAYNTTNNELLDFFSVAGAMRTRRENEIVDKFSAAYRAEPMLTTRALFYTGDVRGGLGERRTFRTCLKWLANHYPKAVSANIHNIAHYNRWDSMFVLEGTRVENEMWGFIEITLKNDLVLFEQKKPITLLAKWMPSINASSKETRRLAKKAIQKLGIRSAGNPDLGLDQEPEGEVEAILWKAFEESLSYEFDGDCYATENGLARNVKVRGLHLVSMAAVLKDKAVQLLDPAMADENGNYPEAYKQQVLREAAEEAGKEEGILVTYDVTLQLIFRDGQWQVAADKTLLAAISGGLA